MSWNGIRVLVTGAGGFIGSHLCAALVREGAELTAFVRYTSTGSDGLLALNSTDVRSHTRIIRGDLRDADAVCKSLTGQEVVFHLGALIAIPYSYVHPAEVADVNLLGTMNMLVAARDASVRRFVQTSTSEVYGTAVTVPIDETHPIRPQSPYAASKVGADALCRSFHLSYGLPISTLRPFNTYGPRQSTRAVIPTIVSQAISGERIELGSLEPSRDFTFVDDTVAAFLAVAEADDTVGDVFNAGTGHEISIGALADLIVRLVGRDVPVVSASRRKRPEASEVHRLVCDASKLTAATGWIPKTDLAEGLGQVVDFLRQHPGFTAAGEYAI